MRQISPFSLWIGHAGDGRDFKSILSADIQVVVQLALEELPIQPPRELIYLRFPLLDGQGNDRWVLQLALAAVARLVEKKMPTLVCCGAGMSRSPAVLAGAMSLALGESPDECLKRISLSGSVDAGADLWQDIKRCLDVGI